MNKTLSRLRRLLYSFFDNKAAAVYLLVFAASIGIATFIENDFGTSAAQKVVFRTKWFEALLVLFAITLLVNIAVYRMIQNKKWPLMLFHLAIVVIIIGAGITRYFGYEGMMHIREGEGSNIISSSENHLIFDVQKDGQMYHFYEEVLFASLGNNHWNSDYQIGSDVLSVSVEEVVPNPAQILEKSAGGKPIIKIVFGGAGGREEYFLSQGESKRINGVFFNFTPQDRPDAINIIYDQGQLLFKSDKPLSQMVMATQQRSEIFPDSTYHPLMLRSMYSDGINSWVFGDFQEKASLRLVSGERKIKNESLIGLRTVVGFKGRNIEELIIGQRGVSGRPAIYNFDDTKVAIAYGSKDIQLPFGLELIDFTMEKYPGTNSASSYESKVRLVDPAKNISREERIYMNHILDHGGFRFFQSSFDPDEKGSYLSVNHDFWGTWITYLGYFLLTIGMFWSMFDKKSRFQQVNQKLQTMHRTKMLMPVVIAMTLFSSAQLSGQSLTAIDKEHAALFSTLVVQDFQGRMKPLHTLDREILRKIYRKESIEGQNADQVILGMISFPDQWQKIPMIKIGNNPEVQKSLSTTQTHLTYDDFFNEDGSYKLRDEIRRIIALKPIDKSIADKEMIKIDERVNIANMVYTGRIFKIIPVPEDPEKTWFAAQEMDTEFIQSKEIADNFFGAYVDALRNGGEGKGYDQANQLLQELEGYQREKGIGVTPSSGKIRSEILLNNLSVFSRLSMYYGLLGLVYLIILFLGVFKPDINLAKTHKILFWLFLLGFAFHTLGLGLRWYVSGRAPWSNGYESMIYIAWTTTLAGLIFARKSIGGLAATLILAATLLLVAGLSFLDPEITPLVPVLKSYWLTIHVSMEAGSYGFLMLGALIGLLNLILLIFITEANKERIKRVIQEMSFISEITLIGGLTMVSIGTYLGGVWANESWGRYWGWDAKETWALVTVLVYAFILHMRLIPKISGLFAYNLATLFGWATVLMTYYGVNYYLSGLHSYAAGDPVPIPVWVYVAVVSVTVISLVAYFKKRKYPIIS
ncbi:MAG: cytochrome c biogenesis protein CcsA [Saprospiraceae bacterium]|nr:cytochrome c biogenesis protein CcsA [Saprospiraceae bacterium]